MSYPPASGPSISPPFEFFVFGSAGRLDAYFTSLFCYFIIRQLSVVQKYVSSHNLHQRISKAQKPQLEPQTESINHELNLFFDLLIC